MTQAKSIYYPPGGILIWLIIAIELLTFSVGIIVYIYHAHQTPEVFAAGQQSLNTQIGFINTLILLTSGFFMALCVQQVKRGELLKSQTSLVVAILLGIAFVLLKMTEYRIKLDLGLDLTASPFFTYYWLLTGFHFMHVVTGLVILAILFLKLQRGAYDSSNFLDLETGGAFWHQCDIIWLLLFPVLYLL